MKNFIVKAGTKKVFGILSAVVTGIFTVTGALADQKKAQEFESLKAAVSELQKKMGES